MRAFLAAVATATALAPATARAAPPARPAAEAPPILVFHAPADAPDTVDAARDGLERLARRRSSVLIDLSPRPPVVPRAGEALRRAIEAYQELRYDLAVAELDRALAEATATGAAGLSPAELSDLFLYRGLVETQRGDATRAWEQFLVAATLAPSRRLDPVRFSPTVIETFTRAATAIDAEAPVDLTVEAPAACKVWVDGRSLTGLRAVAVHKGSHFARVECPGHEPFSTRFSVDAASSRLRPTLTPSPIADRAAAIREARRRGGATMVWAVASTATGAPTVTLELVDLATGAERGRVFAPLEGPGAAAALVAETNALIDRVMTPPLAVEIVRPRRWYQSPWLWGAAGVALATAVLLPLAIDSPPSTGFDVEVRFPR